MEQTERRPAQWVVDCGTAMNLLQDGALLPARLWAAWMAECTGLHTYGVVRNAKREIVGFVTTLQFERTLISQGPRPVPEGRWNGDVYSSRPNGSELEYFRPSQIARQIFTLIGTSRQVMDWSSLLAAILRLEEESQRGYCLEACGLLADDVRIPAETERRMEALAARSISPQLRVVEGGSGQVSLPLPPPMTEPREAFEAELAALKEGRNRRGQAIDPLPAFFGGDGATE